MSESETCEASGMSVARCKATDICDCFSDGGLHPEAFTVGDPADEPNADGEAVSPSEVLRIVAHQMAQTKRTMVPLAAVLETLYEVADRIDAGGF